MNNWFPFFSMLFWFVIKVAALTMLVWSFSALLTMRMIGFDFWYLLLAVLAPAAAGFFLLTTELVFDLGTAEQRRRQSVSK